MNIGVYLKFVGDRYLWVVGDGSYLVSAEWYSVVVARPVVIELDPNCVNRRLETPPAHIIAVYTRAMQVGYTNVTTVLMYPGQQPIIQDYSVLDTSLEILRSVPGSHIIISSFSDTPSLIITKGAYTHALPQS